LRNERRRTRRAASREEGREIHSRFDEFVRMIFFSFFSDPAVLLLLLCLSFTADEQAKHCAEA
jgi:hypothetical protein